MNKAKRPPVFGYIYRNNDKTWSVYADTPKGERASARAICKTHNARLNARKNTMPAPKAGRYRQAMLEKHAAVITNLLLGSYRTADSRWVGGENNTQFVFVSTLDACSASATTTKVWHHKRKWSGTNADWHLRVLKGWHRMPEHLRMAGGMLTLGAVEVEPNAWRAAWVTQGRGISVGCAHGYIVSLTIDGSIEHVHADTLEKARETAARRMKEANESAASAPLREQLRAMSLDQICARFGALPIRVADSIRAGNCTTGTQTWIERHFAGRTEGTVSEVCARADTSLYVERAIRAAVLRNWRAAQAM